MSMFNTALGTTAAIGIGWAIVNGTLPEVEASSRYLALDTLTYSDGEFTQAFITSDAGMQATWTAEITQGGRIVCPSGSGTANYQTGKPATMSVDDWTGLPGCADRLLVGGKYLGFASWEYDADGGAKVTISGAVEFVHGEPDEAKP